MLEINTSIKRKKKKQNKLRMYFIIIILFVNLFIFKLINMLQKIYCLLGIKYNKKYY